MGEIVRKTVYVAAEHREMWEDLEALADQQGRPTAALVNQALAEFSLLNAYQAGRARGVEMAIAGPSPGTLVP